MRQRDPETGRGRHVVFLMEDCLKRNGKLDLEKDQRQENVQFLSAYTSASRIWKECEHARHLLCHGTGISRLVVLLPLRKLGK